MRTVTAGLAVLAVMSSAQLHAQARPTARPTWLVEALKQAAELIDWSTLAQDLVIRVADQSGDSPPNGSEVGTAIRKVTSAEDKQEALLEAIQTAGPPQFLRPVPGSEQLPADSEQAREMLRERQAALISAFEELQSAMVDQQSLESLEQNAVLAADALRNLPETIEDLVRYIRIPEFQTIMRDEMAKLLEAGELQGRIIATVADLRWRSERAIAARATELWDAVEQQRQLLAQEEFRLRFEAERLRLIVEDLKRMQRELEGQRRELDRVRATLDARKAEAERLRRSVADQEADLSRAVQDVRSAEDDVERDRGRANAPYTTCPDRNTLKECTSAAHQRYRDDYHREIQQAKADLAASQERLVGARSRSRAANRALQQLRSEHERARSTLASQQAFYDSERRKLEAAQEAYEGASRKGWWEIYRSKADTFYQENSQNQNFLFLLAEVLEHG
jgi:hypothetical protein